MQMWTGPSFVKRNRVRLGITGSVATFLGVAFAMMGVIADASRLGIIGLLYLSWFYLAIASLLFAIVCWIGWAVAVYLNSREPEGAEPESTEPESTEPESTK